MPYKSANPLNPRVPTVKRLIGLTPTTIIMPCAARALLIKLIPIAPSPILTQKYKSACARRFKKTIKRTTPQIPAIAKNEYGFSPNFHIPLFSYPYSASIYRHFHAASACWIFTQITLLHTYAMPQCFMTGHIPFPFYVFPFFCIEMDFTANTLNIIV